MASAREPSASYTTGRWIAVAGAQTWLILDVDAANPMVGRLWNLLRGDAPVATVISEIASGGISEVRGFALVGAYEGSSRAFVRGQAVVRLTARDGQVTDVSGAGAATWVEQPIDVSTEVFELVGGPSETADLGTFLPLHAGVTMASTVLVDLRLPSREQPPAEVSGPPVEVEPGVAVEDSGPEVAEPAEPIASIPPLPDEPAGLLPPPPGSEGAEEAQQYAHLFWSTETRLAAQARAEREAAEEDPQLPVVAEPDPPAAEDGLPGIHTLVPAHTEYPRPQAPEAEPSDLIAEVPWVSTAGSVAGEVAWKDPDPPPTPTPPAPPMQDAPVSSESPAPSVPALEPPADAGQTVNRAALQAAAEAAAGPMVLAAKCAYGHVSPAYAGLCRVCRTPLPTQEPFSTPRPPLGVLRFSSGDEVSLDRGVLMGRSPTPDDSNDVDRPHVVQLASSDEISRNHVEVRLDGWHVIVVDLGSTNGTIVTQPGQPPTKLRENDPLVIEPGSVVSLADEVVFTFEATA